MKVSYNWLQTYFKEPLPAPQAVAEVLTMHSNEVEGIEYVSDDAVIDIKVLPNRAHDLLSHEGVAREVGALLEREVAVPMYPALASLPHATSLAVELLDSKRCLRYSGAVIRGVKVGPSPAWLKERLEVLGQRSINNVVDITNYVLLATGQPLHAFDAGKLAKRDGMWRIAVGAGEGDEPFLALDEKTYPLVAHDLRIIDANTGTTLALAGVKGGMAARVDEATTDIILEAATFEPTGIRATSSRLKLRTDASVRFENELTPERVAHGMEMAAALIQEEAGGMLEGVIDSYPKPTWHYKVGVSLSEINSFLGTTLTSEEVAALFDHLGFSYTIISPFEYIPHAARLLAGKPYRYGASVTYDAPEAFDCSSFSAYLYTEAGVAIPRMAVDQFVYGTPIDGADIRPGDLIFSNTGEAKRKIDFTSIEYRPETSVPSGVDHLGIYLGGGEIIHATEEGGKGVVIEKIAEASRFKNIVGYRRMAGDEMRFVVTVPHERLDIRIKEDLIDEIGRIYGYENIPSLLPHKDDPAPVINKEFFIAQRVRDILTRMGFSEVYTYTFRKNGERELQNPLAEGKEFLRVDLRGGVAEALAFNAQYAELLCRDTLKVFEIGTVFSHGGESLSLAIGVKTPKPKKKSLTDDEILADAVRALANALRVELPIGEAIRDGIWEIPFSHIVEKMPGMAGMETRDEGYEAPAEVRYRPISPYPFVLRDIALFVPDTLPPEAVMARITHSAGNLLVASRLFDEYRKDGRVSYAFRLVFQSHEKTLTDEEVGGVMEHITATAQEGGWEVR